MTGQDSKTELSSLRRYVPMAFLLCVGVSLSVVAFIMVRSWEQERVQVEFERRARDHTGALQRSFEGYVEVLHSIDSLYAASQEVERHEFRELVERAFSRHPGIQELGWVPRVPDSKRASYEASARRDGYTGFGITERDTQGQIVKAARREEYFPLYYVEPFKGNEMTLGFDVASDPSRRAALEWARDTGAAAATSRLTLEGGAGGQFGFEVVVPIYRKGSRHDTLAERRKNLYGFALGAFRTGDAVEATLKGFPPAGLDISLYDALAAPGERFVYFHSSRARRVAGSPIGEEEGKGRAGLHWATTLKIGGRQWSLLFHPAPEFLAAQKTLQAWGVLGGGLLFTALLGAYLFMASGRAAQVERLVAGRTAELAKANQELEKRMAERKQAERALAKQAEQMQALRATTVGIAQELDLIALLDLITRRAAELIGAASGAIYLWDEATQSLSAEAWCGLGEWMRGLRLGLGEGVAGVVAQRRLGLIINDYRTSSYASPLFLERTGFTAAIAEPLLFHEQLLGVLAINNEGTGHSFTEEDRILLSLFAAQAAIAIQNARLYDTVHQRAERIAAINRLTRAIGSSLDLGAVYDAFAREVKHLIAYDRMGIVVPDDSGAGLRIFQLTTDRATTAGKGSLWPNRAGTGIEWVMDHRRPRIERDLGAERLFVEDEVLFKEGIRSSVRLPLIAKEVVIGVLLLDSTSPDCYTENDLELLVPLGEQLAIAIHNSRLYEKIQEDARFRTALAEVARAFTSTLEPMALFSLICERMQSLFQVDGCYLWTLDETAQELVGVAASGHKFEEFTGLKISMDQEDSLSARVARMRKPQIVQDVATSEIAGAPLATLFGSRSLLALPLMTKESLMGVVILNDIHETHRFDEALVRRAEIFTAQAAIAIENARLHLDLRESKGKIEELYTLGVTMQEQMSLEKRLDLILTGAKAVLGFDRINILLPDHETRMLKAVAAVGVEEPLEQIRVPLGPAGGGIAKAFLDRTEIMWGGSGSVPEEWRLAHPYSEIQAFRSKVFVNVPLIVRGQAIGVLGADNKASRKPISGERVRLLRTFAAQAALAIDNARLYEEVTGQAKELERKVEERTRDLKETQVQLIQSGKLAAVGTLAAGVAHELNQPLMVIRGYAQELLEDGRIADAELREDLSRIEAQTTRMTAIVSHLRDFSRQSKGTRQRTDLNQVVTQAFSFLDQQLRTRNIQVVQALDPALPPVWADPLQIEQVLLNLVTNARDAMEKVGKGVIVIRTEQAGDARVALSVTDTGPGIPPGLKARIFDPFFTTKEVGKGTGLGLSICHGIAEEHEGELRMESPVAEGRGARFTLVLPRSLRDASGGERG